MKGQVFLLTGGIVIGILVALKSFAIVQQISSEREILDISVEDLIFRNIENEVKEVIPISANYPRNITDNSIDFLNFTRTVVTGRSLDLTALFVGVLANQTNQTMNITVFQFLRESNLNVSIILRNMTTTVNSSWTLLNDSGIWINNFTFDRGTTYNLTLTLPDKNYEENITVETKTNKDTYTGFFDLRLISGRAEHFSKFQRGIKIS